MTVGRFVSGDTPTRLFRKHIAKMRGYAGDLERNVVGKAIPSIVKRIRKCADECEAALNRVEKPTNANPAG